MEEIQQFDTELFTEINQDMAHPLLDEAMPVLTDLQLYPLFWILLLSTFAFWIYRKGKKAAVILLGGIVAVAITDASSHHLIKENVKRLRPHKDPAVETVLRTRPHAGYSFPSNHSANNFCMATYFAYFYPPVLAILLPVAAMVAFSRVYVGVHYPLDVFGGALWGIFWGFLIAWSVRKFLIRRGFALRDPPKKTE